MRLSSWLAVVLLLLVACTQDDAAFRGIVVLSAGNRPAADPVDRIAPGSSILAWDENEAEAAPRRLTEAWAAAGAPVIAWDARMLLFVGRAEKDGKLSVWVGDKESGPFERLDVGPMECGSADFLPDGRIVFSARTDSPPPHPLLRSSWALFVHDPETGESRRITFGSSEIDPTVLADGRILYAQWQPGGDGRPESGSFSFFYVHPDGSGVTAVHGFHEGPIWKLRPRQLASGDFVYLASEDAESWTLRRADGGNPSALSSPIDSPEGAEIRFVGPWKSGFLIVDERGRIRTHETDWQELSIPGAVVSEVVVAAGSRPQGHLSTVREELTSAQLFGVDGRLPGLETAAQLRFLVASGGSGDRSLGELDLAADGSYFAELPANVPLLLELLDEEGNSLVKTSTPIWLRPGEKRGCVGCHEDPLTAPPNRRPQAVLSDPVDLTGGLR